MNKFNLLITIFATLSQVDVLAGVLRRNREDYGSDSLSSVYCS